MGKQSRPERWAAAVSKAQDALANVRAETEQLKGLLEALSAALSDLQAVQDEYIEWRGNLPENMQNSSTAEKLEEVENLAIESVSDVEEAIDLSKLDEVEEVLNECENVDLPRGFGRD